jgi:hypothetical protein
MRIGERSLMLRRNAGFDIVDVEAIAPPISLASRSLVAS